jgi:hypothetical protein
VVTQDLICFFPEFTVTSGMIFNVEFKLVYGDTYPPERVSTTTKYTSLFRMQSNTLDFTAITPNMNTTYVNGFTSSESPNFYASATNVGSSLSSTYSITGNWNSATSALSTPFIYINFMSAGPIPTFSFCSDTSIFLQCRVYSTYVYLVVAQLKSSSTTVYTMNNGGVTLLYPSSQFFVSGSYGAAIYVGTDRWYASSSLTRSKASLTPISTNSFLVFADTYGSKRSNYDTNIFFSVSPGNQYLYNYAKTGSKMVISWSGITNTENCQIWVENEPTVKL